MDKIGKYTIVAILGKGAMGVVYKGLDPVLHRPVAIKTLSPDLVLTPETRERFFREAEAPARLGHPNIVAVYDLDEQEGVPYIVMEYLDGFDLRQFRDQGIRFTVPQILNVLEQVALGLDYAHRHGVVHRDVKPANVILLDHNTVKIVDFGVAHVAESTWPTRTNRSLGTPAYMSPEQVRGEKVDRWTDQFSLGVIAYELLSGVNPFKSSELTDLIMRIATYHPPSICDVAPECPPEMGETIMRMLAKERERRLPDLFEFAATCRHLLQHYSLADSRLEPSFRQLRVQLAAHSANRSGGTATHPWEASPPAPGPEHLPPSPSNGLTEVNADATLVTPGIPLPDERVGRDHPIGGDVLQAPEVPPSGERATPGRERPKPADPFEQRLQRTPPVRLPSPVREDRSQRNSGGIALVLMLLVIAVAVGIFISPLSDNLTGITGWSVRAKAGWAWQNLITVIRRQSDAVGLTEAKPSSGGERPVTRAEPDRRDDVRRMLQEARDAMVVGDLETTRGLVAKLEQVAGTEFQPDLTVIRRDLQAAEDQVRARAGAESRARALLVEAEQQLDANHPDDGERLIGQAEDLGLEAVMAEVARLRLKLGDVRIRARQAATAAERTRQARTWIRRAEDALDAGDLEEAERRMEKAEAIHALGVKQALTDLRLRLESARRRAVAEKARREAEVTARVLIREVEELIRQGRLDEATRKLLLVEKMGVPSMAGDIERLIAEIRARREK